MNDKKIKTINWYKFEETLGNSVVQAEYILARALAVQRIKKIILKHKSEKANESFKSFLKEVDKANITDEQRIDVISQFNVITHLV
jgi:hypothetical protein